MKPNVLFVDDEPQVLESLRALLRKEPFRILTAESAAAALEILARESVAVVVSDERMPGVSGSELLTKVKELYPSTVRIMLTGQASLDAVVRAINEGEIYRFLSKPLKSDELGAAVRRALEIAATARAPEPPPPSSHRGPPPSTPRGAAIDELEAEHPGITRIELSEGGAIVIEGLDDDFSDVIAALGDGAPSPNGRKTSPPPRRSAPDDHRVRVNR
ncbi:MAG: response regulator [Myxococcales bacterium]|jgi:DNA-binding response OmpR family regulator|nr:response regulator [Myxococcales bacterium]